MSNMANIHIRDVPPEAVEALRAYARQHHRSLNAEVVAALVNHVDRERRATDLLERLETGRQRWREAFPEGFPPGLEPETIIRRARDTR
jgi:plasmid stability protein